MRMRSRVRAKKPAPMKGSPRFTRALGTPVMIVLVLSVMGAAILLAVSRPSPTTDEMPAIAQTTVSGHDKKLAASTPAAAATVAAHAADATAANASDANGMAEAASARKTVPPVTITGCLEQDDETFRLKNAMGEDAPRARSWKSGFLKKSPAPIEVIDASHRLKLPAHVGQRVSVTGVLVGREMQLRSLQRVAASCNQKS